MKLYWTPIGIESLKTTSNFITTHWNTEVLDHFLDLTDKRIKLIKANPKIAPTIDHTNYRRLIIHKHVSLFYIIDHKIIKILLLWDNRQNPRDLIEKLTIANKSK